MLEVDFIMANRSAEKTAGDHRTAERAANWSDG